MGSIGPGHERAGQGLPRTAGPAILAAAATGIVGHIEKHHGDVDAIFGNSGLAPEMAGTFIRSMHV